MDPIAHSSWPTPLSGESDSPAQKPRSRTDLDEMRERNRIQDLVDEAEAGPAPLEPGENPFDPPEKWVEATIAQFRKEGLIPESGS